MELIDKSKQFLTEANQELKRVAWPERKHVFASTWVVVGFVIVLSIMLGLVDFALSKLVRLIFG